MKQNTNINTNIWKLIFPVNEKGNKEGTVAPSWAYMNHPHTSPHSPLFFYNLWSHAECPAVRPLTVQGTAESQMEGEGCSSHTCGKCTRVKNNCLLGTVLWNQGHCVEAVGAERGVSLGTH